MVPVAVLILTFAFTPASGDPWPAPSACAPPLPKSYVSYHLGKGEKIVVDGKLDDAGWKEVGWTLPFMGKRLKKWLRAYQCNLYCSIVRSIYRYQLYAYQTHTHRHTLTTLVHLAQVDLFRPS